MDERADYSDVSGSSHRLPSLGTVAALGILTTACFIGFYFSVKAIGWLLAP
jgi:hypothetical protein